MPIDLEQPHRPVGKADEPQVVTEAELELQVERKLQHEKDGESLDEAGEYVDEIYDMVDAVVPRTDDPTLPALTIRVWVLGTFFGFIMACMNTLFTFRTNTFQVSPYIAVLLSLPLGKLMALLPSVNLGFFNLNPGHFNYKEHALIYVFANSCTQPAYALYNIIGQKYQLYQDDLTTAACVFFGIATQCFGYGLAGLCRRYLVRPAAMLWPQNLGTIALLNSLNREDTDTTHPMSRFQWFWIVVAGITCWQFFPNYIAPLLSTISILCYVQGSTKNPQVTRMLGSAYNGMGMLSFTLDWSLFNTLFYPITTPLWALLNQFMGLWLVLWIVVPIMWVNNAFGKDFILGSNPVDGPNGSNWFTLGQALNTPYLMNKHGNRISAFSLVNQKDLTLNQEKYDKSSPIYISTYFAVTYMISFIVFAACIVHVGLWYGKDVWHRFRSAMRDLDANDIHAKMMDVYPEVPDLWYIVLLGCNFVIAIGVCQWGGFQLPWWGVILGFLLALVSMIPIGVIQAISGQQIGLNVMSEFLIGLILPGRIAAVMAFKTFSYMAMSQGLLLVSDLKLGHYMKIPPRAMFSVQLFSTILAVVTNVLTSFIIYQSFGRGTKHINEDDPTSPLEWMLQSADPPTGWSANGYRVFLNAGAIWGAIGPARFFGPGSPYVATLWGFLIGAILPVIPWAMHKFQPDGYWHLVNIPVMAAIPLDPGTTLSILITPLAIGIFFNYFLKKYRHSWWKKYAYVTSAALDSGTAIALTLIFIIFQSRTYKVPMPIWALNRGDPELCADSWYITCTDHANAGSAYGATYNITLDDFCNSISFGSAEDVPPS